MTIADRPAADPPVTGLSQPAVLALMLACFTGTTGSYVLGPFLPVLAREGPRTADASITLEQDDIQAGPASRA
jgi:hypothetical protein